MAQQQIDESEEHEQNLPRDGGPMVRTLVEATIRSLCALQAKSHRCRSPRRTCRKQCSQIRARVRRERVQKPCSEALSEFMHPQPPAEHEGPVQALGPRSEERRVG